MGSGVSQSNQLKEPVAGALLRYRGGRVKNKGSRKIGLKSGRMMIVKFPQI